MTQEELQVRLIRISIKGSRCWAASFCAVFLNCLPNTSAGCGEGQRGPVFSPRFRFPINSHLMDNGSIYTES